MSYVLEGSVRKVANRVRVTAQLIEAETGGHIWADRYDRTLDDIFAIQDELTMSVVAAIEPSLRQANLSALARQLNERPRKTCNTRRQRRSSQSALRRSVEPAGQNGRL